MSDEDIKSGPFKTLGDCLADARKHQAPGTLIYICTKGEAACPNVAAVNCADCKVIDSDDMSSVEQIVNGMQPN